MMHDDLWALYSAWARDRKDASVDAFADFVFRTTGTRLSDILVDAEREALIAQIGETGLEGLDGGP